MEKAIVLLSGGMNSAVAAASLAETHDLHMLFADLRHRPLTREMEAFDRLCHHFEVQHHWRVELSHFKQVGGNAYVDPTRDLEDASTLDHDVAGTFVAGLIPTLLDVAASFAFRIGARHIVTGLSEGSDIPGPDVGVLYPDNRREFIMNYQYMIDSALPEKTQIKIETPLIDFSRAEIVKLGGLLKVPFESTWSCYEVGEAPCGKCFGCARRAGGFLQAAIPDPLIMKSLA
jgi:7-cyano-7-deazaguanine synthase